MVLAMAGRTRARASENAAAVASAAVGAKVLRDHFAWPQPRRRSVDMATMMRPMTIFHAVNNTRTRTRTHNARRPETARLGSLTMSR
jgi:hypothetical protein